MGNFFDKLPDIEKVMKAARHPLSLASLLALALFYWLPPDLLKNQPQWVQTIIVFIFIGIVAAAFLRLIFQSNPPAAPPPPDDGAEFRLFLARENSDLLAKWVLFKAGEPEDADEAVKVESNIAEAISAIVEIQDAPSDMLELALEKLEKGETGAAERLFEVVLERENLSDAQKLETLFHLGTLKYLHDTPTAENLFRTALVIEPENMKLLSNLALVLIRKGELREAEEVYQCLYEVTLRSNDFRAQAATLGNLGILYQKRGKFDVAETQFQSALDVFESISDERGMASCLGNLGNLYREKNELDLAEKMYLRGIEIDERLNDQEELAACYGNLGGLYYSKGSLDDAEQMFKKALNLNQAIGRIEGVAKQYGNLGALYGSKSLNSEAEEMFNEALKINLTLGRKEGVAIQHANLGKLFQEMGDTSSAKENYEAASILFDEIEMPHMVNQVKGLMASSETDRG